MGYRPCIHRKHIVELGQEFPFPYAHLSLHTWFCNHDVDVVGGGDEGEGKQWVLDKEQLKRIPEGAYGEIDPNKSDEYSDFIDRDELKEFVKALVDAPTGDYAYISWC